MNRKHIILIGIILLAFIIRVWQIGNVPSSPDWDEVALGYNAYSIIHTARDEYGKFLPVVLRSYDDYKPALYTYLAIPFIAVLGLSVAAVRLPSVLFGLLTILATYFLVKELFGKKSLQILHHEVDVDYIALLASFLLTISPWHIQFSRIAFEANVGLAFNIFALLFFLKALKKPFFLPLSFFCGACAIYTYQSEKVFTPLLFIMLIAIYWKDFFKLDKKLIIGSLIFGLIVMVPMLTFILTNKNALLRAQGVSIFSDQTGFLMRNAQKVSYDAAHHDIVGLVLDNRRLEFAKAIVQGYIAHFNFNWLFITGDIERHHAPFMGLLYLFELPFIFIGIYMMLFGPLSKKAKLTLLFYFLIVPIPASITTGVPHAVRTINFLPMYQIFSALGLITSFLFLKRYKKTCIVVSVIFILFASINITYYFDQYFVQLNYFDAYDWQYGYAQAISYLKPIESNYPKIVVSNEVPLDQSYMFFLFYLKYDPSAYLASGGTLTGGYKENHKGFANYTFRPIDWKTEKPGTLIIGRPSDIPSSAYVLKTVYYPNGDPAVKIAKKQ